MDSVVSELARPARDISEFTLNGNLDAALRASSAQYDPPDQISRLRIKLDISQQNDCGMPPLQEFDTIMPSISKSRNSGS